MIGEKEDERCMNFALCWIWALCICQWAWGGRKVGVGMEALCVLLERSEE